MLEAISTAEAPRSIGHYSQAISANGFIFVSGQVAIDPATHQVIAGNAATQTERIMKNLGAILKHAGSCLERVVRSTVFLKDMDDFAAMDDVCAKYFGATAPARSTVEVARLPKNVLVEIDVIAVAKSCVGFFQIKMTSTRRSMVWSRSIWCGKTEAILCSPKGAKLR